MLLSPEWMSKRTQSVKVVLQVYMDGIVLLDKKKKKVVEKYKVTQIKRYVVQKKFVLVDCGSHRDGHIVIDCGKKNVSAEIVKLLDTNISELAKIYEKKRKTNAATNNSPRGQPSSPRKKTAEPAIEKERVVQEKKKEEEKAQPYQAAFVEKPPEKEKDEPKNSTPTPSPPVDRNIDLSDVSGKDKGKKKRAKPLKKKKSKGKTPSSAPFFFENSHS